MQRKLLTILFACLFVWTARADQEAKGDSIYEQMVEWSLTGKRKEMLANEERALRFFYDNSQWEKGVPASLFMAQTIRLYRALAKLKVKPADIATYMNSELSDRNDSSMFVTMFMGCIDLDTATLEFCNCGHNPPVIGCGSAEAHFLEMLSNAPIGLFPDMEYQGETIDDITMLCLCCYA